MRAATQLSGRRRRRHGRIVVGAEIAEVLVHFVVEEVLRKVERQCKNPHQGRGELLGCEIETCEGRAETGYVRLAWPDIVGEYPSRARVTEIRVALILHPVDGKSLAEIGGSGDAERLPERHRGQSRVAAKYAGLGRLDLGLGGSREGKKRHRSIEHVADRLVRNAMTGNDQKSDRLTGLTNLSGDGLLVVAVAIRRQINDGH